MLNVKTLLFNLNVIPYFLRCKLILLFLQRLRLFTMFTIYLLDPRTLDNLQQFYSRV